MVKPGNNAADDDRLWSGFKVRSARSLRYFIRKISVASVFRLCALMLVVSVAWGITRDRLRIENWKTPLEYSGDSLEFIGWIKAASEGGFIPFYAEGSHRLGAPYQADWADYPTAEKFLICFLGLVAKIFGLAQATNFGVLFVHLLSAVSFYICCRILKYARIWSFVGAALFSLTYYSIYRGLGHLHLACCYTLPFAILSGWLILSSKRLRPWDPLCWICLATALVMGLSAPYNLNIYLQLLCFSLAAQFFGARRKENLQIGVVSLALAVAGFAAINARTILYGWTHGKNTLALARNYFEAELYALKPIEFAIPPRNHHVSALADIGAKYASSAWVKGEMFSAYLGLIVLAGMVWIFIELFLRVVQPKRIATKTIAPHGPQVAWIIGYSIIGGVNCVIALGGFQLFRATVRYSIFISALVLLFMAARLTIFGRRWSSGLKFSLAGVALLIGLFDQLPNPPADAEAGAMDTMVVSDRAFGSQLDAKLPAGGMVFQLPVMVFPEAPSIRNVSCYEMLRPYLFTRTLRYSYGAVRGRPREDWQWDVEKMPPPQMIEQLEKYGFAAIYVNRKCYADRGEDMLKQFAAAGRNQFIEDDLHEQVCVLLNPSTHPELPHTDDRALLQFNSGWTVRTQTPPENRLWASTENNEWSGGNDATVSFFNDSSESASFSVQCVIAAASPGHVAMRMNGQNVWSVELQARQSTQVNITVTGHHGYNKIHIITDGEPYRPKDFGLPLSLNIANLQITKIR